MADLLDPGPEPDLQWVPIADILVDSSYQRELDEKRVKRILTAFRWDHFGAIVLAPQPDGRFAVTDGQHRLKAAEMHPRIKRVPAVVISAGGNMAEAENFLAINRGRKVVTPVETYWAGLAAGDENAKAVHDVLAAAGCDVVAENGAYRPGHTNAVGALTRCIARYGDAATIAALKSIRAAWPDDAKALRGTLISALARINRENREALDPARMVRALGGKSPADLTAAAEGFRKLSGGSAETALAKAITEIYNKGLSANRIFFGTAG